MKRNNIANKIKNSLSKLGEITSLYVEGTVFSVSGLVTEITGMADHVLPGDAIVIASRNGPPARGEVVGFNGKVTQAMLFDLLHEIGPGSKARAYPTLSSQPGGTCVIDDQWLGRVIDPLGIPVDGRGPLIGSQGRMPQGRVPPATLRARLGPRLDLGVRALECFVTCRQGQRLGLFSGSGVGKSTLLAMIARHSSADIIVVALVGERGREVREFIEDELGPEGLQRAVVVVATSDSSPLLRRKAADTAMTVAEHFRDQGKSVLLLMDSVTRFCLALREIAVSKGEPPTMRGYPPSVFSELPRFLERAGPGYQGPDGSAGFITAIFTVLVEGDDHNEPVADTVRGILDGHVVLDRHIAETGRYPAINILRSLSRSMPGCNLEHETELVHRARKIIALHADMADMVRLGAYRHGSDDAIDEALILAPRIDAFLHQQRDEVSSSESSFAMLKEALMPATALAP